MKSSALKLTVAVVIGLMAIAIGATKPWRNPPRLSMAALRPEKSQPA